MKLVELPEDEPWTVHDFLANTDELCVTGARELQTKSVNVEDAANELINMLLTLPETPEDDEDFEADEPNTEGMYWSNSYQNSVEVAFFGGMHAFV